VNIHLNEEILIVPYRVILEQSITNRWGYNISGEREKKKD